MDVSDGRKLSANELRELSNFRRSIMRIKPEVGLEVDFHHFSNFVTRCPIVMRVRDKEGTLRGMFAVRWVEGTYAGRSWRLFLPEYFIFHDSLRGSPVMPWAVVRTMVSCVPLLVGKIDIFLGGVGYPTGVLAVDRLFGAIHFHSDPDMDPITRHLLDRVVNEIAGPRFDGSTGCVYMPTIPPRPSARWFQHMAARPTLARYERICPNWLEGYALPVVWRFRVDFSLLQVGLRTLKSRW